MIAILAIGSELLDGRVLDTNSQFLTEQLRAQGLTVSHIHTCDDVEGDIVQEVAYLLERANFLIVSGGLGPTSDDLTREALARFVDAELELNESVLLELKALYQKRQRPFDPSNIKQATFPKGSLVIPNPIGTAAGFCVSVENKYIFSLPGVPKELKSMFADSVLPFLKGKITTQPLQSLVYRIFGLPESQVGSKIQALGLPKEIVVSYRALFPEVQLVLKHSQEKLLQSVEARVLAALGEEYIFSRSLSKGFESALHDLFLQKNLSIAVAESCTAGMVGAALTATPGSSHYFLGGCLTYSNESKQSLLEIPDELIQTQGAVSHAVALHMAKNVRVLFGSSLGISVTGIAGPDGGSPEKPVGTFFVGYADARGAHAKRFFFQNERDAVRRYSTWVALDCIRRFVFGLPLGPKVYSMQCSET